MEYNKYNNYNNFSLNNISLNDIINIDGVHDIIMATQKEKVKKIHPYAITPPTAEGGRWQTYYKGVDQKRKIIRAQSEESLLEKLVIIYFSKSHIDKLIFHELYKEWLEYKKTVTNSPNTIKRHEQHYHRYFEQSKLHAKKVSQIDELFLEAECNRIVKDFNLARKEWGNIKTILNGMFEYAVRRKYLVT